MSPMKEMVTLKRLVVLNRVEMGKMTGGEAEVFSDNWWSGKYRFLYEEILSYDLKALDEFK